MEPPADWSSSSPFGFERSALAWPPAGAPPPLAGDALRALSEALGSESERAVRAAVLLARSADPRALEALLQRLEQRVPPAAIDSDAVDLVAATALWPGAIPPDAPERLSALAVGEHPHPSLDVRVECAASALAAGRDETIPFLLRVLRALTPAERLDPPDWPRTRTLAWAKSRASQALSARAGLPWTFHPDSSFADQMRAADALEAALGAGAGGPVDRGAPGR